HYALRMVACFGRKVGKEFESLLILKSESRSVCLYPRLQLVAVCKMKSVQERPLIVADRHGPLTRANRLLELPNVNLNEFWIEPEFSSYRDYDIASQRMPDRVDRLIERDRKSTRLNSSHVSISYAVFCLKKKKKNKQVTEWREEIIQQSRTVTIEGEMRGVCMLFNEIGVLM